MHINITKYFNKIGPKGTEMYYVYIGETTPTLENNKEYYITYFGNRYYSLIYNDYDLRPIDISKFKLRSEIRQEKINDLLNG